MREPPGKHPSAIARSPRIKTARGVLLPLARLGVGIGLLAYLATSRIIDFGALSKLITAWPISLAAVAIILLDIEAMALRLSWLFRPQGLHLSAGNSLQLALVSSFFATFLPGAAGGDLAKLFYAARENKGRRTEIVTVVVFDRVIGLFSLLVLPLLFAPLFPQLIQAVAPLRALLILSAILALFTLVAFLACLFDWGMVSGLGRWAFGFMPWGSRLERAFGTIRAYRHSPGILLAAFGASLVANLSFIAVTALAILILHPGSLSMKMCLVIPMGDVANSLPLTPGGLGVGETAFDALFRLAGLQGGAEALLCWRIWRALVGLLGLVLYLRGPKRWVHDADDADEERLSV